MEFLHRIGGKNVLPERGLGHPDALNLPVRRAPKPHHAIARLLGRWHIDRGQVPSDILPPRSECCRVQMKKRSLGDIGAHGAPQGREAPAITPKLGVPDPQLG